MKDPANMVIFEGRRYYRTPYYWIDAAMQRVHDFKITDQLDRLLRIKRKTQKGD